MSDSALWFALIFVLLAILLSLWKRLGLEKEIAISTARMAVQLFVIGYVLQFFFRSDHPVLIGLLILMMLGVAAWNAARRGRPFAGAFWRILLTLTLTELLTMGMLAGFGIIAPTPQYLIPLSGMIIGNAMIVSGLYLSHMTREVEASRGEIETWLCLGANPKRAIQDVLKRSVKSSLVPTFDTMKTLGLVQLPGTMTGMIIAGADPVDAVRYQILIMFTFAASAAITAVLLSSISYKLWFTPEGMLRE